ncbi:dsDNA nuclease domain-containing protein [Listeria grayi]|uniref:CD-NTase associated protein 4-like DNA endonuclease domain-containing protein n=1 Tax=Listeria grayi DSM 20601 TaxID=525367 RepID=D7UZJ0_LISGR|nr:dsDNA nuclease domain-containing protein [Listeria grayi]EFI82835.1 hypothetical protein HMPREF0556_11520 [Listeria grayi DSM 20601]
MRFDNGGAIAQKGFNYQNAVISLVAIRNYKKPNFEIYVEASEDFEVQYDGNYHAYIQVKGTKSMSLKKLLSKSKLKSGGEKPSIIEKNLNSGGSEDKYKIVVYHFTENDLKRMQEQQNEEELFEKSYLFSDGQKKQINHPNADNLSLICTNFKNDKINARTYLKGEMADQNISIDGKSDILLDHLDRIISEKAEFILKKEDDRNFKRISAEELNPILQKTIALEKFGVILSKFDFNEYKKAKINLEKNKIVLEYVYLRNKVVEKLKLLDLDNLPEVEAISEVMKLAESQKLDEITSYAVCISAYCDVIEGVS